jgi:Fe2+ transport system protein FeoA
MFKDELNIKIKSISLNKLNIGDSALIVSIPGGVIRSQLLRFGMMEGQIVFCLSRLPGGTMVIKLNNQEIALGSTLANKIQIEILN